MNKIDEMIGRALTAEDRALLASHGEPGYVAQATGIFRGSMGGVMWLVNIVAGLAFLAAAYALWQVVGADDALRAIKWGVGALFLSHITMICKSFMGNHLEANRMLRELKRIELQIALQRDRTSNPA